MIKLARTAVLLIAVAALVASLAVSAAPEKTLDNLQAAFNGESNAHAKYAAYAEKADKEGFPGVASLFRAASKAEQVHADGHAAVIKAMGAVPKADVKVPEPKSTKENLEDAIKVRPTSATPCTRVHRHSPGRAQQGGPQGIQFRQDRGGRARQDVRRRPEEPRLAQGQTQTYWVCTICGYTVPKNRFRQVPLLLQPQRQVRGSQVAPGRIPSAGTRRGPGGRLRHNGRETAPKYERKVTPWNSPPSQAGTPCIL